MQKIDINLHPSLRLMAFILLAWLGSEVIIFMSPLAWWIKILLFVLVMVYGLGIFWQHGLLRDQQAILGIHYQADDGWWIQDRLAKTAVQVNGDSTVTTILSVLRFTPIDQSGVRACVVLKDSMGHGAYRRLVVALKSIDK